MAKKSSKLSIKVLTALLENNKPMKPEDLSNVLNINQRSIRYALNILHERNLVIKVPDMTDLRTNFYRVISPLNDITEFNKVLAQI